MKNLFKLSLLAGVTALTAACVKDDTADPNAPQKHYRKSEIKIEAYANDAETRTSMDTDNKKLVWQSQEEEQSLAVIELLAEEFEGVAGTLDNGRVGKGECASVVNGKASFNATVYSPAESDNYSRGYLVTYPYESFKSLNGSTLEVTMPAVQTPSAVNDIDPAASLLWSSDFNGYDSNPETLLLPFHHVAAYSSIRVKNVKLQEGESIISIVLTSNEEDKWLAGAWKFDYANGSEGTCGADEDLSKSITLDVSALETVNAATEDGVNFFFGALPCGDLRNFTVKIITNMNRQFERPIALEDEKDPLLFKKAYVDLFSINFNGIEATPTVAPDGDLLTIVAGWANQFQGGYGIEYLFDGETDTDGHYHSPWNDNTKFPVTLQFRLASASTVSHFDWYTRNSTNGLPGKFDVYYRISGSNEWLPVISGKGGSKENAMFDMGMKVGQPLTTIFPKAIENVADIQLVFRTGMGDDGEGFIAGHEVEFFGTAGNAEKLPVLGGYANQFETSYNSGIHNLLDGDREADDDSHIYHSPWSGTTFPVELTFEFESASNVSHLDYYTRTSNGRPGKFDLYYLTLTENGVSDWIPVVSDKSGADNPMYDWNNATGTPHIIFFQDLLEDVIAIKMTFYSGSGNFITGREVEFYGVANDAVPTPLTIISATAIDSAGADAYQPGSGVARLFDGIKGTDVIYHSSWNGNTLPIYLTFNLESVSDIRWLHYYTRASASNGNPGKLDVYYRSLTSDGISEWMPAISGKGGDSNPMYNWLEKTGLPHIIYFPEILENVFQIQLRVYSGYESFVSGDELELFGTSSTTTYKQLTIASGEANQKHSGQDIDKLYDGILDSEDNNMYHSPWALPYDDPTTVFPVTLSFKFNSASTITGFNYYTRIKSTSGRPGAFDVQYRRNGDNEWRNLNDNYNEDNSLEQKIENAMFDMGKTLGNPHTIKFEESIPNAVELKLIIYDSNDGFVAGREIEFFGYSK